MLNQEKESRERNWNEQVPENSLEFKQNIITPSSADFFKDINKDYVLSNLTKEEIYLIRELNELIGMADSYGWEKTSDFLLRKVMVILATARSRGGWQQEMLASQIRKETLELPKEERMKKAFNIGLMGRRKE